MVAYAIYTYANATTILFCTPEIIIKNKNISVKRVGGQCRRCILPSPQFKNDTFGERLNDYMILIKLIVWFFYLTKKNNATKTTN